MRKAYKNKRDFFKAESEKNAREAKQNADSAKMWRESAEQHKKALDEYKAKCEADKKKRWSAVVFCENCLEVSSVSIPPEVKIEDGDCVVCRVRGRLKLVRSVNCDRTI